MGSELVSWLDVLETKYAHSPFPSTGIFFLLFVSSNLPLLLAFLNTEQHPFYSRI